MEAFNIIPTSGTYGAIVDLLNYNFRLARNKMEELEHVGLEGFCGVWDTVAHLAEEYPTPESGWWAYVGSSLPWDIYRVSNGQWADSLSDYTGSVELSSKANASDLQELANSFNTLNDNGYVYGGVVQPSTQVSTSDALKKRFFLAFDAGTYTYCGSVVLPAGSIGVITQNNTVFAISHRPIIASGIISDALDQSPTLNSRKPVESGGVYQALSVLRDDIDGEIANIDLEFATGETVSDVHITNILGASDDGNAIPTQSAVMNTITVSAMDGMNGSSRATLCEGGKPSKYTVVQQYQSRVVKVGTLDVFSTANGSVLTQVLTTHFILSGNGTLTSTSNDNETYQYYRSCGTSQQGDVAVWSTWKRVNSDAWEAQIANVYSNFDNYYTKSNTYNKAQTYNKDEINTLINNIKQFRVETASSLPAPSQNTMYVIWLIPSTHSESGNVKDEYITIYDGGTYKWEQIGTTAIDLTGYATEEFVTTTLLQYYTKADIDAILGGYYNKAAVDTLLGSYYTKAQTDGLLESYYTKTQTNSLLDGKQDTISDLATIRSGAAAGATAVQPANVGYFECSTTASTAAKAISATGYSLITGSCIRIKMENANTADNATLNINSTGAKALYYDGKQVSSENTWEEGEVIEVYYDGTRYQSCNALGGSKREIENDEYVVSKALIDHDERINKLEDGSLTENEAFVIAKAIAKLNNDISNIGGGEEDSASGVVSGSVTHKDSDRIAVISSSYGAGNFALAGKNWVAKISLFSDYAFQNNSADGASYMSQLSGFRNNNSFNCKYALCVNCENSSSITINTMVKSLDNICRLLVGMGTTPVIGTQYKSNIEWSNAFKEYADSHHYEFMDLRYYCRSINKSLVSQFDAGTHLGTRSDAVMADLFTRYVDMLPRPKKSLKVFKLRDTSSVENLDSLVFHTNEERAERFKELNFVYWGLADPSRVDRPNQGAQQTNEYETLYSAAGVTFTGAALVSAVLPCTNQHLTKVSFAANINGNVSVYARSVVAKPYPAVTTYVRFTVMEAGIATPSANDVYNDGTNNYTVYTIVLGENGSNYTMYCVGTFDEEDPTIGNLTKVGGDGPSTIPYTLREASSFSADDVVLQDTVGHWVELTSENGMYNVPQYRTSVDYDKIHFLVVGSSFTMSSPSVSYEGVEEKDYNSYYEEMTYNEDNTNTELIDESVFGNVGTTLTHWVDGNGNGVVTENVYEGSTYLPSGCGSIVNLTNTSTMEQSFDGKVTSDAPMSLEVWCRYFPAVYSDGSGNQMTLNSYDYTKINIQIGNITFKRKVSTAWGKIRLDLRGLYSYSSILRKIKISAENAYGVQVCKVSLKYK